MHRQSEIKMARLSFRSHFHRDSELSTSRAGIKGNSTVKKKITAVWTVRGPEQTLQVFFFGFFSKIHTWLLSPTAPGFISHSYRSYWGVETFAAGTAVDLCSAG